MKRIALALIALTFSASSVMAEDIDNYGNVLQDQVSQSSGYSSPDTNNENHGSVLLDQVANNRGSSRDIEVGGSEGGLFETDAESAF
jgi:hypothetical protein